MVERSLICAKSLLGFLSLTNSLSRCEWNWGVFEGESILVVNLFNTPQHCLVLSHAS